MSSLHTLFLKTFNKKNRNSLLLNYLKGNTSRFGSAIQVLPCDIGEYLSSFFNPVVVVVFISIFILFHFYFESNVKLYASENLTPCNQYLAWKFRELKTAGVINISWNSKGIIKLRRTANERPI